MSLSIDLNCDMGESFGHWKMGNDQEIMPFVSSANIACGFHAGDPGTMRSTVAFALANRVALGAHPGLPDREGFGRRKMAASPTEVYDMVVYQMGALAAVAASQNARLHHIKAHGALYHMSQDEDIAQAIIAAVVDTGPSLIMYAMAGSKLAEMAQLAGLTVASEVFADRTYQDDGTLTSRDRANAMITDIDMAIDQALQMIQDGTVTTVSGKVIPVKADTLCLHGDQPGALQFAQALRAVFEDEGIAVAPV
ncbi:MAG: 5-oxoprolinase subunit PxpA [Castellaniella sp.]